MLDTKRFRASFDPLSTINRLSSQIDPLPTKREALTKLEEHLRPVNQGTGRPEASMRFAVFVERQWSALVLPTLKLSTQHGYKNVLNKHVLPYWRE
jgi:hypothetical protein